MFFSTSQRSTSLFALLIACSVLKAHAEGDRPLLKPNDRLAIVGGSFVERSQKFGNIEAELQCRRPHWKLSIRNLGWSGDDVHGYARKRFDEPNDGYERLLSDLDFANPTVVLVAYGFSEASDGGEAVERFSPGLDRLVAAIKESGRRIILLTPFALPGVKTNNYRSNTTRLREVVIEMGDQARIPVITTDSELSIAQTTHDGLFPNSTGYAFLAQNLANRLVGGRPSEGQPKELFDRIAEKNEMFFHRYRPQNETYLFLFRKHEQGNNASEIAKFDPLIEAADEAIWKAAAR